MLNEGETTGSSDPDFIREDHQDGLKEIDQGIFLLYISFYAFGTYLGVEYIYSMIFVAFIIAALTFIEPLIKKKFTYPRLGIRYTSQ
jgi:hypothetical protein